jgi:DNA polymerase III alpha subunit
MKQIDAHGQIYFSTDDICKLLYQNPNIDLTNFLVDDPELYNKSVKKFYVDFPKLSKYQNYNFKNLEEFDKENQSKWHMPKEYQELDIAQYLLDLCKTQEELQRVGQELMLYQDRDLFMLLRFMKYLVDTLRKNNLVWGVGRGSSVASYILFLIGIHKINSLYYDLDITEFLK